MTEKIEINGTTLLPIKEVAKLVSYSRDHITRLARERKIVASLIGRQWYIDLVSLKSFIEAADLEQQVRQRQLSDERKREQLLKDEVKKIKESLKDRGRTVHLQARLVSSLALFLGLLTGVGFYTFSYLSSGELSRMTVAQIGSTPIVTVSPETDLYQVVNEEIALPLATPQVVTTLNDVIQKPSFADESEVLSLSEIDTRGIFLLPQNGSMQELGEVKEMFSDDLTIEFIDQQAGIIVYVKEDGERVEFPFVSVPLYQKTDVNTEGL